MLRRLFTAASVLSLLLCVASAVLWVRGRAGTECWYFHPSRPFVIEPPDPSLPAEDWCVQWQVGWGTDGVLSVARQVRPVSSVDRLGFFSVPVRPSILMVPPVPPANPGGLGVVYLPTGPETKVRVAGVEYVSRRQNFARWPGSRRWGANWGVLGLKVPLVLLFVLTALLPIRRAWQAYRQRLRSHQGRCASCGYDLRASTVRCPECGASITMGLQHD